MRIGTHS